MRVLLDENVDRRLKQLFGEQHEVLTVPEQGWAGMKNGELLERAGQEFDVFVSTDRGIPNQQNHRRFGLAVVILEASINALEALVPLMDRTNAVLGDLSPGEAIRIRG